MKKISLIIVFIFLCFFITACDDTDNLEETKTSDGEIDSIEEVTKKRGTLICTRSATATNAEPFFNYTIDYKDDEILKLHSIEGVTSEDSSVLDEYEEAYKKINSNYVGLKYYDTSVYRTDNSVTWDTTINYEKIDIGALLDLEGEENNIIENGKAKLSTWLELSKKVGTTCSEK